jgi:hypothetical protein
MLRSTPARSIITFVGIGGLLSLNAVLVMVIWEACRSLIPTAQHLNFLEATGIVAFAYVVAFALWYPLRNRPARQPDCENLSKEDRERLRQTLITECGCKEHPNT